MAHKRRKRLTEKQLAKIGRELLRRRRKAGITGPLFKNVFLKKKKR